MRGRRGRVTEREWRFQAKRWNYIGPKKLREVVREAVPDPTDVPYALVIATACRVSNHGFEAFHEEAAGLGIAHHELWTRDTLNDKLVLNVNARAAAFYFGDGPAIEGTVPIPLALDRSAGRDLTLLARDEEVASLRTATGDVIIVGRPGTGKTRLAMEADGVRFVSPAADANAVADSLRHREPDHLVIDDAGLALDRLEMLLELRREGHAFRLIATTWSENLPEIRRRLPDATIVELELLERKPIDELLKSLGIGNYYLRLEILAQAEGRVGWAVALADLAKRGEGREVVSGRGLIRQVEPYLRRLGASSTRTLGFLSVMAALNRVRLDRELPEIEAYLSLDRLEGQQLLQEAAAAGVLEIAGDSLRIAPNALRHALVGYWFFEQKPAPWPIDQLVDRWPDHRGDIVAAVLEAARDGSEKARAHVERLLPRVIDGPYGSVEKYVALDEEAAERAIREINADTEVARFRVEILETAARRFALPAAVSGLLDVAVGDRRPEGPTPHHPIRVLGEVGSRVSPHGETSFGARLDVMRSATAWLDADASVDRRLVWAQLMVHLLDPKVEGNFPDSGSPMTVTMQAGWEAPEHLEAIQSELWPPVASRIALLDSESLVKLVEVVDDWIRLERGLVGAFGSTPSPEQSAVARRFLDELLPALRTACEGKPAAQMALRETTRLFRVRIRQTINPEFRILSWMPWRLPGRGKSGLIASTVGRLADCWAAEDPAALMTRLAGLSAEAARRNRTLEPMIHIALEDLARRVTDVDGLVAAGLDAGLTWQIASLLRASIEGKSVAPDWLATAFTGPARIPALRAALEQDQNRTAAEAALAELGSQDLFVVETALLTRSRAGADWVAHALLQHQNEHVRGYASLWFSLDADKQGLKLPADWYDEWGEAFALAPLEGPRGNNYQLGQRLTQLVDRDPDLVERWLMRQLRLDPGQVMSLLPDEAKATFHRLPRDHRDRIMRSAEAAPVDDDVLDVLLGADMEWLARLLDDRAINVYTVVTTLNHSDREVPARVAHLLALAPVLVPRGVDPMRLARSAELGGWMGEESANYELIRTTFEKATPDDPSAQDVRAAGIALFETKLDEALREERARRVSGDL